MAVAKKAKAAAGKPKAAQASNNKKVPAKPAAKPAVKKPVAKSAPLKKAAPVAAKKSVPVKTQPAKKAAAPAPKAGPAKKVVESRPAAPAKSGSKSSGKPDPKPVPPAAKKSTPAPAKSTPVKSEAKTPAPVKSAGAPVKTGKTKETPAAKPTTSKVVPPKKGGMKSPAPEEMAKEFPDLDPADAKAKKIMKELEETMDLANLKPRIKVPTPVKTIQRHHQAPPLKLIEPTNTNKQKFTLEFEFRSSPKILFNALSDSSGLAGWFADEVRTKDDKFTFVWEGGESYARLVAIKDMFLVRFQWAEDTDGTYFQFEIKQDELTGEIALVITDFALPGERETNIRLWESQVQNLRMLLGSL